MKYIFLAIVLFSIFSCNNAEEPVESFDKSWILGNWKYLGSSDYRLGTLDNLTNEIISDTLFLEDAVVFNESSSNSILKNIKFKTEIISVNTDSNYIQVRAEKYPIFNKLNSNPVVYEYIKITAKYIFDGKNKMTMIVNGSYIDSLRNRQVTNWEAKYERMTK